MDAASVHFKPSLPVIVDRQGGFTLVEIVVVILLVGILAVAILPRFSNTDALSHRGFSDQLRSAVQFARKAAIAERRNVCVNFSAGVVTITRAGTAGSGTACSASLTLINPATGSAFNLTPPSGVTVTASSSPLVFGALGSANADTTVTLTGDATQSFSVVAATGYVQ